MNSFLAVASENDEDSFTDVLFRDEKLRNNTLPIRQTGNLVTWPKAFPRQPSSHRQRFYFILKKTSNA